MVFTGAGVSADSGLSTFRDSEGLWHRFRIDEVATVEAWRYHPERVLEFYNERRKQAYTAEPNAAHIAVAELEKNFNVVVITQNVDDLHERAGSSNVIHLHGQLKYARSSIDASLLYDKGDETILPGELCDKGSQLRPHIVLFGEEIHNYDESLDHISSASKVLVIGTSLAVFPAAGLLVHAKNKAEKIIVAYELEDEPIGFRWMKGSAVSLVPDIVGNWLSGCEAAD